MPTIELKGVRVLLVKDQMIIAMHIEEMLRFCGCEIVGPVGTLQAAVELARDATFDVAVLDINLDGQDVYPVARMLQTRGMPFILATGYGESTLPEQWRDRPHLIKPFRREQLEPLITALIKRARHRPGSA